MIIIDAIWWLISSIAMGYVDLVRALLNPVSWMNWGDKEALMRFIYYGGSAQFFFVILDIFLTLLIIGIFRQKFLWAVVRVLEGFANTVGRFFAWAGLFMVLQQFMIVFLQRIFRVSDISMGPFGFTFTKDLSWWSEELKLYNAMIVALCCAYTFVQGGHVRVDLVYARCSYHRRRIIDMAGSILFMMPAMVLTWLYAWYFFWRNMVTPPVSATDTLDALQRKAGMARWNVETIGFSPNGFDAYFLFKLLLVAFTAMMFVQAWTFLFRSLAEYREGPDGEGKYLDKDPIDDEVAALATAIH